VPLLRVLIADDQPKVRSALRLWFQRQSGLEVTGEAADVAGVREWIQATCPDVVLLDWELPGGDVAGLVAELRARCPGLAVVVLSGRPEAGAEAQAAGVDTFVSKCDPPDRLRLALERLA
jgi:DNA-binding NarL/FixJ family response regulator